VKKKSNLLNRRAHCSKGGKSIGEENKNTIPPFGDRIHRATKRAGKKKMSLQEKKSRAFKNIGPDLVAVSSA